MPRISVIIPVYNAKERLLACLESVAAQTEKSLEIIAVNDGSTDESGELLTGFAKRDARLQVVTTDNRGAWAARNEGLSRAQGEFIAFCDADDVVPPDAYKRMADAAGERYDVVIGKHVILDSGGGEHTGWDDRHNSDAARFQHCSTVWERLTRRDFLARNHLRFSPYMLGEDQIFVLQCYLAKPRWVMIEDVVYKYFFYRDESDNLSLTHLKGLKYFGEHLRCRRDLVALARGGGITDSDTILFLGSAGALRDQLLRIGDGREAEEAMALYKDFIAALPWDAQPGLFEQAMRLPADAFYAASALEYFVLLAKGKQPTKDPADIFREGGAGLRKLASCAAAWLEFKLRKGKR